MRLVVFFVWLPILIISVASNPVAQKKSSQQCNVCQPNPYQPANPPTDSQQVATQNNPYALPVTVQNQTPNRPSNDGSLNQLLLNKIFTNPGLQKILDPNTKLYNQNGQEIQRQPNSGTVPNVINNYFIVPPEFFIFNDTRIEETPKKVNKRRKNNSTRKGNQTRSKPKPKAAVDVNPVVIKDAELNNKPNNSRLKKGDKKRKQNQQSAKITKERVEADASTDPKEPTLENNQNKRKRKQGSSNKTPIISTPSPSDSKDDNIDEVGVACPVIENNKPKRRKQTRKESIDSNIDVPDSTIISDAVKVQDGVSSKSKKVIPVPETVKLPLQEKKSEKYVIESETSPHLKNIESPVDNSEAKVHKENRQTRNSKTDVIRNGSTKNISPIPDDIFKTFFPYMYMGNNIYPNGNYPFNLEQFYGPYFHRSNKKPKRHKTKNNQNNKIKKDSPPNVIEVKLKQKKQNLTTAADTLIEEDKEELYPTNLETTTLSAEPVTNILMAIPLEQFPVPLKEESKYDIPDTKFVITKANLEMPPTMIEDLQEYMIPELGREDIVPTIHANGIINDYYPIFHDDFHYTDDESYYLKDLEDDRHFYSTDLGNEELLNRERRKYDRTEDYRVPNHDVKDRINFRRGYKYEEKDRTKDFDDGKGNSIYIPAKTSNEEFHFKIPPSLEHPDFKTKKVGKESFKSDSGELREPIYAGYFTEQISDKPSTFYSDIKSPQVVKLDDFDADLKKDKIINNKPKSDRIETVFAKSRVVKYGVAKDESEEVSIPMPDEDDDKYYGDSHTTYVVAKSLGYDDDFYW